MSEIKSTMFQVCRVKYIEVSPDAEDSRKRYVKARFPVCFAESKEKAHEVKNVYAEWHPKREYTVFEIAVGIQAEAIADAREGF